MQPFPHFSFPADELAHQNSCGPSHRKYCILAAALFALACAADTEPVIYPVLPLREELRITDPAGSRALSYISGAAVDDNGSLYIIDWSLKQVIALDSAGHELRRIGSAGEGPGQFALPGTIGFFHDTLWVADPRLGRISFFTRDGRFVRSISDPSEAHEPGVARPTLAGILPDGSRLVSLSPGALLPGIQPSRTLPYMRVAEDGSTDTLFRVTIPGSFSVRLGNQIRFVQQPFDAHPLIGVSADGAWWVEVERTPANSKRHTATVTRFARGAGVEWKSDVQLDPVPIPRSVIDSIVDAATPEPVQANALREWLEVPAVYPLVSSVAVCSSGCVWLQETSRDSTARWIRLDERGNPNGEITLGSPARMLHAGATRLWVVETDAAGISSVIRYALAR